MKIKSNLKDLQDKIIVVEWKDAKSEIGSSLESFIKKGFVINNSVGWLKYADKEKIVLCSEWTIDAEDSDDFTMIPIKWIVSIKEVK